LKYWFPELCQAIGERYREYLGEAAVRARADRLKVLNEILEKFVAEGCWPSKRAVDKEIKPAWVGIGPDRIGQYLPAVYESVG